MLKQLLSRKRYEKVKKYIDVQIKLETDLRDNITVPKNDGSEFYYTSKELYECHSAKIVCLKSIKRFIEIESLK